MLTADKITTLNGVKVNEFLLTKHNPNKIAMPSTPMKNPIGITVHNTPDLANVNDDAEQYTRATYNGNMKDVRVHFYVDDICAWQNLPLNLHGWHAGDGKGNGNMKTIAIECIMGDKDATRNQIAEDNCARLVAYLCHKYGWTTANVYTHNHWMGQPDKIVSGARKNCPVYILPHWSTFLKKVETYIKALQPAPTPTPKPATPTPVAPKPTASTKKTFGKTGDKITLSKANLYAASTSTTPSGNPKTGTYYIWNNEVVNGRIRITNAKERVGKAGQVTGWVNIAQISTTKPTITPATPKPTNKYAVGAEVKLVKGKLYVSSTGKKALTKTKTYYIYDGIKINGRYRVTNNKKNCGKKPIALYVSGWVEV